MGTFRNQKGGRRMKCWHCGNKTKNYEGCYIEFAKGEVWKKKKVWICAYCCHNLRKGEK